jgi:putative transposase
MIVTRRVTYRLYPSRQQEQKLFYHRRLHCLLYNAAIANRRNQYQHFGKSVDYYEQQNCLPQFKKVWTEYQEINSQALQATLKRVELAYQSFFQGLRGYPKFKAGRKYSGWTYPAKTGWKAITNGSHGKLKLSKLGDIRMRGEARTWGEPTSCTIFYRQNKWYASITVKCEPIRTTGKGVAGLDLGCKDAITFDTGETISAPKFYTSKLAQIKTLSKEKRRKRAPVAGATRRSFGTSANSSSRKKNIRGSKRWLKATKKVSRLQRQAGLQRKDWAHQTTAQIVSSNSLVVGEKLTVKNMTKKAKKGSKRKRQKAGLNRSILDTGMSIVSKMLAYKEEEAGGMYLESPTRTLKPTQRCNKCWKLTPKSLSDRIHDCQHCSEVCGRDENAAKVNLQWALGTSVQGNKNTQNLRSQTSTTKPSKHTGGWKQVWEMKRQKPPVQAT